MPTSDSSKWEVLPPRAIEYGHPKRTFRQKVRKVLNTLLFDMAYSCPINSWRIQFHRWRGCHIGKGVYVGRYCFIDNMYPEYVYIYDRACVNAETMLLTHFNPFETYCNVFAAEVKPVVIGHDAIVAVRCTIMPGVRLGDFAVVSAGCTVDGDIPDGHMATVQQNQRMVNISPLL